MLSNSRRSWRQRSAKVASCCWKERGSVLVERWRRGLERGHHRQVLIPAKALDRSPHPVVGELAGTGCELRLALAVAESRDLDRVLSR